MSKEVYIVLESWESYNDSICEVFDAICDMSQKNFATAILLKSISSLIEKRFTVWQQLQSFGFTDINQARVALIRENERRERSKTIKEE